MYKFCGKPFLDVFLSFVGILILSPLILIVIIMLCFANEGAGVFFVQERAGKNSKNFKLLKFKTMSDKKDENGLILPDKERITKIGKFIRSSSIDELPQLINVLKGDMSLIGPRPLLPEYIPFYNSVQIKRLNVRPGITGWAQVHGRNELKLSRRFKLDVWYVNNISIILDMKIIYLTIYNLIFSKVVVCRQDLIEVDDLGFDEKAFGNKKI